MQTADLAAMHKTGVPRMALSRQVGAEPELIVASTVTVGHYLSGMDTKGCTIPGSVHGYRSSPKASTLVAGLGSFRSVG